MISESLFESIGAIHLHSNYSDGTLSIPEIAEIAENKELDYLMFSDHNTLEPRRQGLEGWYGKVLVIIGCEVNDSNNWNHYLAFRISKEPKSRVKAKDYVRLVKEMGGFGVIAHPSEKRNFSDAYPPYPWTDWDVEGFDGIEIWNQLSEWLEGVTRRNFLWRIWHPLRSIRFPVWETLKRWDDFNQKRRVVGIGGIDVHAFPFKLFGCIPVEIYPYKVQFKSIRTHLLTKKSLKNGSQHLSFSEAEKEVFDAFLHGRCFVSNYRVGDGRGFRFWVEKDHEQFQMGSRIKNGTEMIFRVQSPLDGIIRFIRNGQEIKRSKSRSLIHRTCMRGVYRVEIFRKRRGWIYSNPIVVTG